MTRRSERWVVRHDSFPDPVEFSYPTEEQALESYERGAFYDPATGWGVTLIHRITETTVIKSTKPEKPR